MNKEIFNLTFRQKIMLLKVDIFFSIVFVEMHKTVRFRDFSEYELTHTL